MGQHVLHLNVSVQFHEMTSSLPTIKTFNKMERIISSENFFGIEVFFMPRLEEIFPQGYGEVYKKDLS